MPSLKPQTDLASPPPRRDASHLAALDALRGLAILLVVIGHYLPGRVIGGTFGEILDPWAVGGVILFFMLSGFLIERNLSHGISPISYALRRMFRILPAYWVSIVVLILLHRLLLQQSDFGNPRDTLFNMLLLQDVGKTPLFNDAFWTLLIEAKFYVLAPFLMLGGKRLILLAPYLAMAANGIILARRGEASNLLTYLTFCLVGMNFGLWFRNELSGRALVLLVFCSAISIGIYSPYYKFGLAIFGLISAVLLSLALKRGPRLPALGFVGAVSYSWYLYHSGVGYPLMAGLEASRWLVSPLVSSIIAAIFTFGVACLSYRLIEQPLISLGRTLEKRVQNANLRATPERL